MTWRLWQVRLSCAQSPLTTLARNSQAPPASIWMPDASATLSGSFASRLSTEPLAQVRVENKRSPMAAAFTGPEACPGSTSRATPPNPSAMPANTTGLGLVPPGRSHSRSAVHTDTIATMRAASPEGIPLSSTQATAPFPTRKNNAPSKTAHFQ
jgi:hypothetical protein